MHKINFNIKPMEKGEIKTGTTIMAVKTSNGIIIGADCRASVGSFVSIPTTNKLIEITENIYACISGSLADCQRIVTIVKDHIDHVEISLNKKLTVRSVANIFSTIIYNNSHLCAGILIAGYDENGSHIFNVKLGGAIIEEEYAIGGSGSLFIYGFCDSLYNNSMNDQEKFEFIRKSIALAIKRDGASGNGIRLAVLNNMGGISKFYYKNNEINEFLK